MMMKRSSATAFDELFDVQIRPIYKTFLSSFSGLTLEDRKLARDRAKSCFTDRTILTPLLRLIDHREYQQLTAGVVQRGRALQMFLRDHYFGQRAYREAGLIPIEEMQQIIKRYASSRASDPPPTKQIQFWYAPDIIRDAEGRFRVMEDNIGFVGGFGDLHALASAAHFLGAPATNVQKAESFYAGMMADYQKQCEAFGGGKIILISYPDCERPNHEDSRIEAIFSKLGAVPVTDLNALTVTSKGLNHSGERVGFVIINIKPQDIDICTSATGKDKAVSARNKSQNLFWSAASRNQFGVSYSPGLNFVGDKQFYTYVPRLIEFYLNEPSLLQQLPVLELKNRAELEDVRDHREQWVIKLGKGQAGESVWVGRHLTPHAWKSLMNRVAKYPRKFIAQEYCAPSRFLGRDADIRPLAVVSPFGVNVSPFPWGRAAGDDSAKTNIACGGMLTPIYVT